MPAPRSVSVVVPLLDDAEALRECLAALARQTRPADEVVVVDNGSVDDGVAVALAAGATVLHEPVRGIASAASHGYDAATGDVIARIDSDTVVPRDWIERALPHFDDPLVAAVTGPGEFRDLAPFARAFWRIAYMRAYFVLMTAALARPPLYGSNMLMRRAAWLAIRHRVHRDDPRLHDDVDLAIQFDPTWRTRYDGDLVVTVSGDPVRDPRGLVRRTVVAWRTFVVSGPRALAPARIIRRVIDSTRPVPPLRTPRPSSSTASSATVGGPTTSARSAPGHPAGTAPSARSAPDQSAGTAPSADEPAASSAAAAVETETGVARS